MKKRVLLYLNVTKEDLIDTQEKVLKEYCRQNDWQVVKASTDHEEMLEAVKGNKVDVVLVDNLCRLSKKTDEVLQLIQNVLIPNNVALVSISDDLDTSTAFGKLKVTLLEARTQQLKEEIRSTMKWLDRKNNKTKE